MPWEPGPRATYGDRFERLSCGTDPSLTCESGLCSRFPGLPGLADGVDGLEYFV